jgi:SPP1 gp7 family putative phage head morphogenesis protein
MAGTVMPITATNVAFLNTRYIAALDKATRINKHLDSQIKKLLKKNSKVFEPLYKTFLKCKSPAELNKINPADLPQNKELQYLLTRILQYSELYGRYSNLGTESFSSSNLGTKSSSSSNYIQNSKLDLSIDYDMTYYEAAEWFESLKVIYAPDFYDELRRNAGYSWTISYITQAETLNKCQKYITEALKGNTKIDPNAMKEAIADFAVRNGDAPLTPWHLDTITRTNLQSAFSKGRYIEQRNSDNPYWQYMATLDGRETELCHSLDGQVFRKNDAFWGHYYPPNHFNCRSTVVTLDEDTLKEEGLEVEQSGNDFLKKLRKSNPDLAKKLYPGHGFRTSPRRGISQWITKKANQYKTPIRKESTPVFTSIREAQEYLKYALLKEKVEKAIVLNKNGKAILEKIGSISHVEFTTEELKLIFNQAALIIHNHPASTSFSPEDIVFAIEHSIDQMQVVVNNGVNGKGRYTIKGLSQITLIEFSDTYIKLTPGVYDKWIQKVLDGVIKEDELYHWYLHDIWDAMAKELKLKYSWSKL